MRGVCLQTGCLFASGCGCLHEVWLFKFVAYSSTAGIGASKLALGVFLRKLPVEAIVAYSSTAGIGGARRRRVAERSVAMKREGTRGTPESPSKMPSLPFLRTGFLAKTRESLCKQLTRPPWRYCYKENGKCSFGTQVFCI